MKITAKNSVITGMLGCLLVPVVHAGAPVWTYSAPNPASVTVSSNGTAEVHYTVTNQSSKPKNLQLKATAGLSASSCYLAAKGSTCTLTIAVNGSQIPKQGIHSGPVLCEQGNPSQCYQPAAVNQLNISVGTTPPPAATYTGIYVFTDDYRTTYSVDNGSTWNPMLNQMSGTAITVDSNGVLYKATSLSGSSTLIYTPDGVNWSSTSALPDSTDRVSSLFALNTTVYTGTSNGGVFYSTNQGTSWIAAGQPDGSVVGALAVSSNGTIYAGTEDGSVFSSSDNGVSWNEIQYQLDGSSIRSLAVSTAGTLYVVTDNTVFAPPPSSPLYSTDNGVNWVSMGALPSGNNGGTTVSVAGTTVYVGTDTGNVLYTTDNGTTWTTALDQPDGSQIRYLATTQSTLSPVFVETSGIIPVHGGQALVTVKNLSTGTASNVQAQLPSSLSAVVQDASDCASVAPQGSCTLRFTSSKPYAPQNIPVTASNLPGVVSRVGLVFSMNGYPVYNVDSTHAYVVDNTDVSGSPQVWSQSNDDIPGITENDTAPPCSGATDGQCNSQQIVAYYGVPHTDYAAGLCYESTLDGASKGDWYLPSTCELNGGLYLNTTTNSLVNCTPVTTGIFSLHSLQLLTNLNTDHYWSSTEFSGDPPYGAWDQYFAPGGGGYQSNKEIKGTTLGVRCVRALSL